MTLTKARIIDSIYNNAGLSKLKSRSVVENIIETIKTTLENGEDVLITGFGKFCVKEKRGRRGRNPLTGADLLLRPRRNVTFRWSEMLKEKMNLEK